MIKFTLFFKLFSGCIFFFVWWFWLLVSLFSLLALVLEVCVGISQMLQKSISRFLTPGITLSIALLQLFLLHYQLRIGSAHYLLHLHSLKKLGNLCPRRYKYRVYQNWLIFIQFLGSFRICKASLPLTKFQGTRQKNVLDLRELQYKNDTDQSQKNMVLKLPLFFSLSVHWGRQ